MPDNLYRAVFHQSFGGRAAHDTFSNEFLFATQADLASEEIVTTCEAIRDALKPSFLDEVHMLRAHVTQLAENTFNRPNNRFKTVEFSERGDREVPSGEAVQINGQFNNPILTQDRVLIVKRECDEGRNGQMKFRGMLLQQDVVTNLDGGLELRDGNGVQTGQNDGIPVIDNLNALIGDVNFVMANPAGYFVQTARTVNRFAFGGIGQLQTSSKRVSATEALAEANKRKIHEAATHIRKLLGNGAVADLAANALQIFLTLRQEAEDAYEALPLPERLLIQGVYNALPAAP